LPSIVHVELVHNCRNTIDIIKAISLIDPVGTMDESQGGLLNERLKMWFFTV